MNLPQRIALAVKLGNYLLENNEAWKAVKERSYRENPWFIPEFIEIATENIALEFLNEQLLTNWVDHYQVPENNSAPKKVGVIMAGNIPLVGFHDFLCVFIAGHSQRIKLSSKDQVLFRHLLDKLTEWDPEIKNWVEIADYLKDCDAYIATGSNNSSRYFEYYFGKYPNIIRRNRTSVAILDGQESQADLVNLSKELMMYFGLGCRNVTKLYVPEGYDFIPLLGALKHYEYYLDFHKYHHNFDYQLAILIMNNKLYMNSGSLLFTEREDLFSPISQVHYSFYKDRLAIQNQLEQLSDVQCIIGKDYVPFGKGQSPALMDYADKVDTMAFLINL
ncbi:MAG TPA: hypothetical protein VL053_02580 [Arachidicoccus sp.]|nr:hypothetical protein [Arachidicoccus sp.]